MVFMESLKGKVVLITGSSVGIGREDAFKFSGEGCKVVLTYLKDEKEARQAAAKCLELGAESATVIHLDVTDNDSIRKAVKQVKAKFEAIDILVNNAGVIAWKRLEEQSANDIEGQIRTNLEGLIKITRECLPILKGVIVNIASGAGLEGYEELTTYCATKWGVRGFTKALAKEHPNLKVYAVNPGTTATRMTGFKGMAPAKVAEVVLDAARRKYGLKSGSDVNVWDYA